MTERLEVLLKYDFAFGKKGMSRYSLFGCYAACIGGCLPTFRGSLSTSSLRVKQQLTLENGTDRLTRNAGKRTTNIRCVASRVSKISGTRRKSDVSPSMSVYSI
jgi:hypothetical protein